MDVQLRAALPRNWSPLTSSGGVPHNNYKRTGILMKLVFLYGPPAAGKLTIASRITARTGYKLLHNHQTFDVLEPVFGALHPVFAPLLNKLRLEIIQTAARTDLAGLVVTHVYGPEEADFIFELKQAVENHGGQVCFVQLAPHPDELARRVEHEDRRQFKKLQSAAELRDLMANWDVTQAIPRVDNLAIDNTDLTADEVADQVIRHFGLDHAAIR